MNITRFDRAHLPVMPWKNGAGLTREVVCHPVGAGLDNFDWRVSITSIQKGGPFSQFPGVDRTLVLLGGGGVRLHTPQGQTLAQLEVALHSCAFSGETALAATLLTASPSEDFNVMTRRSTLRSRVQVLEQGRELMPGLRGVLYAARGNWTLTDLRASDDPLRLRPGQGVWWESECPRWRVAPGEVDAALLFIELLTVDRPPAAHA